MAVTSRIPGNASIYEMVRTGHGSLQSLSKVGLSREDLDLPIRDAARRTGLRLDRLTEVLES